MSIETNFDPAFAAALALREKQIQQNYRPLIGIHKWFARRPGTLFRNLLLSEFNGDEALAAAYWRAHELRGLIARFAAEQAVHGHALSVREVLSVLRELMRTS